MVSQFYYLYIMMYIVGLTNILYFTRQSLTNLLYFVDADRHQLTTPPPLYMEPEPYVEPTPYVEPPQPEPPMRKYTAKTSVTHKYMFSLNTCLVNIHCKHMFS